MWRAGAARPRCRGRVPDAGGVRPPAAAAGGAKACVKAFVARGLHAEATHLAGTMSNPFDRDEALKLVVGGR